VKQKRTTMWEDRKNRKKRGETEKQRKRATDGDAKPIQKIKINKYKKILATKSTRTKINAKKACKKNETSRGILTQFSFH